MTLPELYDTIHGNYAEAKTRLMNDRLIDRFVLKFPADPTMQGLIAAVDAGDTNAAFAAAHTMKGVAANLAFTELSERASALTEQLRPRTEPVDAQLYDLVLQSYTATINAIKAYEAQKA